MRHSHEQRFAAFYSVLLTALLVCSASAVVIAPSNGGNTLLHAIGWQTFDPRLEGNNDSGIMDTTPDSDSTFDFTPFGGHASVSGGGVYLTGHLGEGATSLGRRGFGQAANNAFLQGPTFGDGPLQMPSGLNIEDVPNASDGSLPGVRINMQPPPGTNTGSAWKFRANGNQEFGDFTITNVSSYTFRFEKIHFDARQGHPTNSAQDMDLVYLSGGSAFPSNLIRVSTGTEVPDLHVITDISWPSSEANTSVHNVSASLAASFTNSTAVRLGPGERASFRFRFKNHGNDFGESQIDNLAISGTFQDQNNGFALIDPREQYIKITDTSFVGTSYMATFMSSNGNVDVYKTFDLQDFGMSPIASGVAPGSDVVIDSSATERNAFYMLVPAGMPAP